MRNRDDLLALLIDVELIAALVNAASYVLDDKEAFLAWVDTHYDKAGKAKPDERTRAVIIANIEVARETGSAYLGSLIPEHLR